MSKHRAPRIDLVRRRIAETRDDLDRVERELETLGYLAYERGRRGVTERVGGGTRDYGLDSHGNPLVRGVLVDLEAALEYAVAELEAVGRKVRAFLEPATG